MSPFAASAKVFKNSLAEHGRDHRAEKIKKLSELGRILILTSIFFSALRALRALREILHDVAECASLELSRRPCLLRKARRLLLVGAPVT